MTAPLPDSEAVRLCAEAMGWTFFRSKHGHWVVTEPDGKRHDPVCPGWPKFDPDTGEKQREPTEDDALRECDYDPLHDDAQALALVKRFSLTCIKTMEGNWDVQDYGLGCAYPDLNRAIVFCVAAMQRAKAT